MTLTYAHANSSFDYQLQPQKIAEDTYVYIGRTEIFSTNNGGNIVNTGFIVTEQGVVVFDTGPSLRYGKQLRQQISEITNKPIILVINSHLHPDHFLGNGAFSNVAVKSSSKTINQLQQIGDDLATGLYQLVGDWMRDTEVLLPSPVKMGAIITTPKHQLSILELKGHSSSDLMLFDAKTGVLFTVDLVFHDRAPTTPHAHLGHWIYGLDRIIQMQPKWIVPGHGKATPSLEPVFQTRNYLTWLDSLLTESAKQGLHFHEVKHALAPFTQMQLRTYELERSLIHMYKDYELLYLN